MKVALVVQNYFPSVGGTQTLFKEVAERLVRDFGDDVQVLTTNSYYSPHHTSFKKIKPDIEIVNGVEVKRFRFARFHLPLFRFVDKVAKKFSRSLSPYFYAYIVGPVSPALTKAMKSTDADVILASSSNYLYMQYPSYRSKLKHPKPFVFMGAVHFYAEKVKSLTDAALKAIKSSDAYIANTSYEKERLMKLGVDGDKIEVIGVGVQIEEYSNGDRNFYRQRLNIAEDEILVGYVGRIEKVKGVSVLLSAFEKAAKLNLKLHLVIAGFKTPYCDELKSMAGRFDATVVSRIHFLSNLTTTEKVNLFHSLDVFVLPSNNESFGMVFLEAWACKKPVIGIAIGAVSSVVSDGEDGLLAEADNADDLSKKILLMCSNKEMRTQMGDAGYRKTVEHYRWDVILEKYRSVLIKAKQNFHV